MTTKEVGSFTNKQQISVFNYFQNDNSNQFSNFNLNQSHRCSDDLASAHFNSKSNNNKHLVTDNNYQETKKSWKKSTKDSSLKLSKKQRFYNEEKDESQKRWKNDSSKNNQNNSSTLSLHISAYENSLEVGTNNGIENLQAKPKASKFVDSETKFQTNQDFLEFPRQQKGTGKSTPEVQQFSTSQKLLSPNQETSPPKQKMDEHEKVHYESFFRCQALFHNFETLTTFCERCYMCDTCNKPFARLEVAFVKMFEGVQDIVSKKIQIPYTAQHFEHIKKNIRDAQEDEAVNEAIAVLTKGQNVLQRGLKISAASSALSTKADPILMRGFYRNESRILQYPKVYGIKVPFPKHWFSAFATRFDVSFKEIRSSSMRVMENPAFIREHENDYFLTEKKHPRVVFNDSINIPENVPFIAEIPILEQVQQQWLRRSKSSATAQKKKKA